MSRLLPCVVVILALPLLRADGPGRQGPEQAPYEPEAEASQQSCDDGNLDGGHYLSSADAESREAEDSIAVSVDQRLHKAASFRKRSRAQICFHGDFEQAIWCSLRSCFDFA